MENVRYEWAAMYDDGDLDDGPDEASARERVAADPDHMKLVRRRVTSWKVVD